LDWIQKPGGFVSLHPPQKSVTPYMPRRTGVRRPSVASRPGTCLTRRAHRSPRPGDCGPTSLRTAVRRSCCGACPDPFWFPAFRLRPRIRLAFERCCHHSTGALTEGLHGHDRELGVYSQGGKGAMSRTTPAEIRGPLRSRWPSIPPRWFTRAGWLPGSTALLCRMGTSFTNMPSFSQVPVRVRRSAGNQRPAAFREPVPLAKSDSDELCRGCSASRGRPGQLWLVAAPRDATPHTATCFRLNSAHAESCRRGARPSW